VLESAGGHDELFWQARLSTVYAYISYPLLQMGERTGDIAYFKEALDSQLKRDAINQRLAAKQPENAEYIRRQADGLAEIGLLRWRCCKDLAGALRDQEAALAGFQRILERDAENLEARRDVANAYNNLGSVLGQAHQRSRALEANHKALAIYEDLSRTDPTSAENQQYMTDVRARITSLEHEK
jgi:tetratricopeptide (TPR) repeat protein